MEDTMTARDAIKLAREQHAKFVDLRFTDVPGLWQHFSIPVAELTEELFAEGIGFDGSSIRGFQTIDESDMLLVPDPETAAMDPFTMDPTLVLVCDVKDPVTEERYSRDPRYVARKAEAYLQKSGIADTVYVGPELEFFFFDDIRFDQTYNCGYYYIDSEAGFWNSGKEGTPERPNLGYKPRYKQGYFPVPPMDKFQDIRSAMVLALASVGIPVEVHHHEVGTAGQTEVDMRFDTLTRMADRVLWYKYCAKNTARKFGKTATFMPKPIFQDNGSGMHTHQSLWKDGKNLFFEAGGYADISQMCLNYIGGILAHAPALCALIAPTTNSYRRLVPGYEAPINLAYSKRNRSACVRIPMYSRSEKAKRIEFRTPDPSCNPYLSFAACLMAGLDGVERKLDPGEPIDKDLYELPPEEAAKVKQLPGSLSEVLNALEADHEFLMKGGVFTSDLIRTWIDYKRKNEVDPIRLRPHPWEFALYFDI
jgi:glutamine synthetase